MFSSDGKAEFSAVITPVVNVTWSFRNHFIIYDTQQTCPCTDPTYMNKVVSKNLKRAYILYIYMLG